MTRVQVWSGHQLVFNLKRVDGEVPLATLLVVKDDRLSRGYVELGAGDVEAVLAILLRMREKQRDYAAAVVDARQGKLPLAAGSKAPSPANTRPDGKRRKTTAK